MAVGEGDGHHLGVAPAVDNWSRVPVMGRSSIDFQVVGGWLEVILISGSWVFAGNLELGPPLYWKHGGSLIVVVTLSGINHNPLF